MIYIQLAFGLGLIAVVAIGIVGAVYYLDRIVRDWEDK